MNPGKFNTPDPESSFQEAAQQGRAANKARKRKGLDQNPAPSKLLLSKLPSFETDSARPLPNRDCPDFCVSNNGTVPLATKNCEADQAPPPQPGKFDFLTPKNDSES
jgi:hypothetical protein